jgi:hypothetical protein
MVCTCASASLKRDGLVRIGAAATPPGKPLRTSRSRRRPHAPPTVSRAAISVGAISTRRPGSGARSPPTASSERSDKGYDAHPEGMLTVS